MRNSTVVVRAAVAAGLLFGASVAGAADLPARSYYATPPMFAAAYDWSGFYLGANGGIGGERNCWTVTNVAFGVPLIPNAAAGCNYGNNVVAGGQAGYRWQSDAVVFGIEAQGDWANLKGSNISQANALFTDQSKVDGLGLFTGQIGYVWNNALLYVKGGGAVTADTYNRLGVASGVVFDQASATRWGGVAGVGVEFAFARNWSVGVEYDHLFMGNASNTLISTGLGVNNLVPAGGVGRVMNIGQDVDMVTARINYRFGGPVVPRY
jgi:outer membrane immunogenic protein